MKFYQITRTILNLQIIRLCNQPFKSTIHLLVKSFHTFIKIQSTWDLTIHLSLGHTCSLSDSDIIYNNCSCPLLENIICFDPLCIVVSFTVLKRVY